MSVCGHTESDSASEEPAAPLREMYEQKAVSKVVRVLTVLAYLLSVSLAAILLSVYYVCVWQSPRPPPLNETAPGPSALQDLPPPHHHSAVPSNHTQFTGGGNTTVNDSSTASTVEFSPSAASDSEPPALAPAQPAEDSDSLADPADNSTSTTEAGPT